MQLANCSLCVRSHPLRWSSEFFDERLFMLGIGRKRIDTAVGQPVFGALCHQVCLFRDIPNIDRFRNGR